MTVIARIHANGDVSLAGEIIEVWPAIDDSQQVDDSYQVDDSMAVDDDDGIEKLIFESLLGVSTQMVPVNRLMIDSDGNIYASEFVEAGDAIRIHSDWSFEITEEFKEGEIL